MSEVISKVDYHIFRFSQGVLASFFPEQVFQEVIATDAFRRLESIHFLGSIDYMLSQGRRAVEERQTRYDHSLAVAALSKRFAVLRGITGAELKAAIVAALLHDIGHAPLSHSLEPTFKSTFDLDHHIVGEKILRGEVRLGIRLAKVFERHKINNFEVMALIAGFGSGPARDLFSHAINVDTIEGVIRSATYILRRAVVLNPVSVIDAFATLGDRSQEILDEFWMLKNEVYAKIIQSQKGLIADFLCKRYMESNVGEFRASYYYGKESELKRDHRFLFDALDDFGRSGRISPRVVRDGEEVSFARRKFYIDPSVVVKGYADINRRYLQSRTKVALRIIKKGGENAHSIPSRSGVQDLFREPDC